MRLFDRFFHYATQQAYERGMRAYEHGDHENAIREFRDVLARSSKDSPVHVLSRFFVTRSLVNLGFSYRDAGKYEEAEAALREVIVSHPDFPDVQHALGMLNVRKGDLVEARMRFELALSLNPKYREPRLEVALLLWAAGRHAEAAAHFRLLAESGVHLPAAWLDPSGTAPPDEEARVVRAALGNPSESATFVRSALVKYQQGSPEAALADLTRAVELAPRYADLRCRRGTLLCELGRYSESLAELERALELDPDFEEARLRRAMVHFLARNFREASRDFQLLLDVHANDPELHLYLGASLVGERSAAEALGHLRAAALEPTLTEAATYYLAEAQLLLDQAHAVIALLEPLASAKARLLLGRVYLLLNRPREAAAAFADALTQGECTGSALLGAARAHFQLGDGAMSRHYAEASLEYAETRDAAALVLARLSLDEGDDQEALRHVRDASDPRSYAALQILGRVLARQGRLDEAAAMLERALEQGPDQEETRRSLGLVLVRVNEHAKARTLFGGPDASIVDTWRPAELPPWERSFFEDAA